MRTRSVFRGELRSKNEFGHTSEALWSGGVTAPLRERVKNAWLLFPSNVAPALQWFLSAAQTCIRAATSHAGFKENDEIVEFGFISTMSGNRNT